MHVSSLQQAEVLVLSSHGVLREALISALRQAGWNAGSFAPDRDVQIGQSIPVVVGPIGLGTPESSVTSTLSGQSTIVIDEAIQVRGATSVASSGGLQDVLAALHKLGRPDRRVTITPRHAEILQHVADGLSVQEAAERLGITAKTVNNHLGAVYRRLGVENLTQAVLRSIRLGFVDPSRYVVVGRG